MRNLSQDIIEQARLFVKKELQHDSSGHDWWHIVRVSRTATMLAMIEGADEYICELSALLHDIADEKLNNSKEAGMNKVQNWLEEAGVEADVQAHVLEIIATMSFGNRTGEPTSTLEGRIVQDADRLDAVGAIGIARAFAYSGWKGQTIYEPELKPRDEFTKEEYRSGRSTAINHFYEKLLKLKSLMNTDAARILAGTRHEEMKRFLSAFDSEWSLANALYMEESLKYRGKIQRIHIVFDASTLGSLRMAFQDESGEVPFMLEDNLMIGPLPEDQHTAEKRVSWFRDQLSGCEERDEWTDTLMKSMFAWRMMPAPLSKYPLVVWAGDSAPEQCGLRKLMAALPLDANVSVINPTKALNSEHCQYSHTGEIPVHKLTTLLGTEQPYSIQEKENLAQEWHHLMEEQGRLRVLIDDKLITVPESYFDHDILQATLKLGAVHDTFKKSARVIGEVLGHAEQRVSDSFIQYRVRELIYDGMLDYEGELSAMRYYSISLTRRGLEAVGESSESRLIYFAKFKSVLEGLVETYFEEKNHISELLKLMQSESIQEIKTDEERFQLEQVIEMYQKQAEKRVQLLDHLTAAIELERE